MIVGEKRLVSKCLVIHIIKNNIHVQQKNETHSGFKSE